MIREFERMVTMYLEYVEDHATRRQTMTLADWAVSVEAFVDFNERGLLTRAGTVQTRVTQALIRGRPNEFDSMRKHKDVHEADTADLDSLRAIEKMLKDGR